MGLGLGFDEEIAAAWTITVAVHTAGAKTRKCIRAIDSEARTVILENDVALRNLLTAQRGQG